MPNSNMLYLLFNSPIKQLLHHVQYTIYIYYTLANQKLTFDKKIRYFISNSALIRHVLFMMVKVPCFQPII